MRPGSWSAPAARRRRHHSLYGRRAGSSGVGAMSSWGARAALSRRIAPRAAALRDGPLAASRSSCQPGPRDAEAGSARRNYWQACAASYPGHWKTPAAQFRARWRPPGRDAQACALAEALRMGGLLEGMAIVAPSTAAPALSPRLKEERVASGAVTRLSAWASSAGRPPGALLSQK